MCDASTKSCASSTWLNILTVVFGISIRGLPRTNQYDTSDGQWVDQIHPDDRTKVSRLVAGDLSQFGEEITIQYRCKHVDGHWIWILCHAKIMETDKAGKPIRIIGTDTCISDMKKREDAQAELAEKLELAIEAAGVGIFEFSPDTKIVHWDDRLLEIYGRVGESNARIHTNWYDIIHPEDREATIAYSQDCLAKRENCNHDYRIIRPDGDIRHLRTLSKHVTTKDGLEKVVGVNIDVTADYERTQELEKARSQLEYEARHDALTGLANRRRLDEALEELTDRKNDCEGYAVLHLDLDHFKTINDTHGHAAGDAVLQDAARILADKTGTLGLVCRTGGDEFVVLLRGSPPQDALKVLCDEIVSECAKPFNYNGKKCYRGVSIGVAYANANTTNHAVTFRRADKALYAAKSGGRGSVTFYDSRRRSALTDHGSSQRSILDAMSRGEITCYYQPQYDAETLAIVGAEALVRWDCPDRGLLAPEDFLVQVADSNVVNQIDQHMLSMVLAQQTAWEKAGISYPVTSLNIAKDRILKPGLCEDVFAQLAPHHALSFELLETAFIDTPDAQLKQNLATLRDMHILIELDDFGSGHSSVVALQTIKPDRIKIDRGLVAPIVSRPNQLLTLSSLSSIARLAGAEIVIEGLETGLHLAAIRNVDCDVLQGFGLHRPVPPSEFARLLSKQQGNAEHVGASAKANARYANVSASRRH